MVSKEGSSACFIDLAGGNPRNELASELGQRGLEFRDQRQVAGGERRRAKI